MNVLIIKLGATGDVVRTTPLLRKLNSHVTWLTAEKNVPLLDGLLPGLRVFPWSKRQLAGDQKYELVINLEDELEIALFLATIDFHALFGAYADSSQRLQYTDDSCGWFDLS